MGNEGSQPPKYGESLKNDIKINWKKINPKTCDSGYCGSGLTGRDGHCAACIGNKCFVFGGIVQTSDGRTEESNNIDTFNLDTESWCSPSCSGDIPPPRSMATMAAVGDVLYVFGGLSQNSGWFDDIHSFNTETNTWSKLTPTGKVPNARDKLASAVIDDNIYIFGGFGPMVEQEEEEEVEEFDEDEEEIAAVQEQQGAEFIWFNDLHIFNTSSRSWSSPVQLNLGVPSARAALAMCAVDKYLVIFGGRDKDARRNDLHIFDTATRKWILDLDKVVQGRQPEPRSFHTMTAVGSRLIVLGGRGIANNHYQDFHIFDTKTREWMQPEQGGDLLPARGVHSAVVVGDSLLVYGGSSNFSSETMQCEKYHNDIYAIKTVDVVTGKVIPQEKTENQENVAVIENVPSEKTSRKEMQA